MSAHHEELAQRAERGELVVKPGTVRRGNASRADAQRLLMDATGTATIGDAVAIGVGRPSLGSQQQGPSPVIRARVPHSLKESVTALAQREQRAESDIVRDAVAAYVEARKVS